MKKSTTLIILSLLLVFCSCEEILLEEDISTSIVELLTPGENAVIESSTINFRWSEVEAATAYQVQIATPSFAAPQQIVTDVIIEENFYSEELPEGDYEWRVKATNSNYATAFSSKAFTVGANEDFSDQQLNLFSPSNNLLSNKNIITLNWGEIEGATMYRIQIVQNGQVVQEKTTTGTHLDVTFPEGQSTWKIRAENETENTLYSERGIFVDSVEPETPKLVKPADKADVEVPTVIFEWERGSNPGSEEIDSIFIFSNWGLSELVLKDRVTTSYTTTLDREKTYYWFMRSYDAAGNIGDRSEVYSFTIEK